MLFELISVDDRVVRIEKLHDFVHVHHVDDSLADWIGVKQRRVNDDCSRLQILLLLYQSDNLP